MTPQDALLSTKVALIVDPEIDPVLFKEIALVMPVWIAGTPANLALAKIGWATLDSNITTFDVNLPMKPPLEVAVGFRDMLGLHHNKMTRLYVYGLPENGEHDPRWSEDGLTFIGLERGCAVFGCEEYTYE